MDITKFQEVNSERATRWHGGATREWSLAEWTNAMCGEAGEAANIAKKILRLDLQLPNKEAGIDVNQLTALKDKLASEAADTIIYALLIIDLLGEDASAVIANVFDKKSIEYGFPERAPK